MLIASKTSLYLPRPSFRTNWKSSWFLWRKNHNQTSAALKSCHAACSKCCVRVNKVFTPIQPRGTRSPNTPWADECWPRCTLEPGLARVLTCPTAWQRWWGDLTAAEDGWSTGRMGGREGGRGGKVGGEGGWSQQGKGFGGGFAWGRGEGPPGARWDSWQRSWERKLKIREIEFLIYTATSQVSVAVSPLINLH